MTISVVRNLRRLSQVVFFGVFFWLILKTNFEIDVDSVGTTGGGLPYPVSIALQFDPLVALTVLLANGTLFTGLLWSLMILIPTIFLGRFFCGWVCPLGTLNHWISEIPSERLGRKGKGKMGSNRYRKYQRIKYYVFFFVIGSAIVGTLQTGLLDPLPLLARSIGTVVLPMVHTGAVSFVGWAISLDNPALSAVAVFAYDTISPVLLNHRMVHFHGILTVALLFLLILLLNRVYTRFWCRAICPLGAMLGLFSRFAILGLEKKNGACDECHKCLLHCQGADNPDVGSRWRQSECHLCLNCQSACPNGSLKFKLFPNRESTAGTPAPTQKVDLSKRKAVASVAGGLALYPLLRSGDAFDVNANPLLVRPPGSVPEDDFLARCIRCGQCMRVCPNNALHPTLLESGLEGIWTPILIPRIGYCEPTCTLCGQVCPTDAITKLTLREKVGDKEMPPNSIGTAFIDRGRCLPWAMATPCIVCEEWCPTSPKAIYLKEETVYDSRGDEVKVKRPLIDPSRCTGCGACEYACPVVGKPAVYVLSVGESRSVDKQLLLERKARKPG